MDLSVSDLLGQCYSQQHDVTHCLRTVSKSYIKTLISIRNQKEMISISKTVLCFILFDILFTIYYLMIQTLDPI